MTGRDEGPGEVPRKIAGASGEIEREGGAEEGERAVIDGDRVVEESFIYKDSLR